MAGFDPRDGDFVEAQEPAVAPTSLLDSFVTGFNEGQLDTTLSIPAARTRAYDRYIEDLAKAGVNTSGLVHPYKRSINEWSDLEDVAIDKFHARVAEEVAKSGHTYNGPLKSHDTLISEILEERQAVREERAGAAAGEDTAGAVAGFAGQLAGSTTDPVVIASMPFGLPARGAHWAWRVVQRFFQEALIGGAVEATVIQPIVQAQKLDIGEQKTLGGALAEGATNVATVALGAGIFGASIGTAAEGADTIIRQHVLRQLKEMPQTEKPPIVRQAEKATERDIRIIDTVGPEPVNREKLERVGEKLINEEPLRDIDPTDTPLPPVRDQAEALEEVDLSKAIEPMRPDAAVKDAYKAGQVVRDRIEDADPLEKPATDLTEEPVAPTAPPVAERPISRDTETLRPVETPVAERPLSPEELDVEQQVVDANVEAEVRQADPAEEVYIGDKDSVQVVRADEIDARLRSEEEQLQTLVECGL